MKILSSKEILKKYNYSVYDIILHYAALSGEIPSNLISKFGLHRNSLYYHFNKSKKKKDKGIIIYKNTNHIYGYQLTRKGTRYLIENNKEYSSYLFSAQDMRKTTNDFYKRVRYRRAAFLYYFFDKLNIDYFYKKNNPLYYFYNSKLVKNIFHMDEVIPDTEFEMIGSKFFGLLKLRDDYSLIYAFGDSIPIIYYHMEQRTKLIVENEFGKENIGTIIFFNTYQILEEKVFCIIASLLFDKEQYNTKQYNFFKKTNYFDYSHFMFCSMDDIGEKQFYYIKHKKLFYNKIEFVFSRLEKDLQKKKASIRFGADYILGGQPSVVLYDCDLCKIIDIFNRIIYNGDETTLYRIICFKYQKQFYEKVFKSVSKHISYILLDNVDQSLKF